MSLSSSASLSGSASRLRSSSSAPSFSRYSLALRQVVHVGFCRNLIFGLAISFSSLITRHAGIDLHRPALDATSHRFRTLDALLPQPHHGIQTAHPVVAIANHLIVHVKQSIQVGGNRAERNQFRAWNF